jgi:hypothetical protein
MEDRQTPQEVPTYLDHRLRNCSIAVAKGSIHEQQGNQNTIVYPTNVFFDSRDWDGELLDKKKSTWGQFLGSIAKRQDLDSLDSEIDLAIAGASLRIDPDQPRRAALEQMSGLHEVFIPIVGSGFGRINRHAALAYILLSFRMAADRCPGRICDKLTVVVYEGDWGDGLWVKRLFKGLFEQATA